MLDPIVQGTEPIKRDIVIYQGATYNPTWRYAQAPLTVKTITGITKSGQAVVTCTHALTIDWPVYISAVVGMVQLNHIASDLQHLPRAYKGYYVAAGSMRLNVDSSRFSAYTSGGELLYHAPVDLTNYTARMQIRATVDATTTLDSLTTENSGIALGTTTGTIAPLITATETAAYDWETGVYDLEIISAAGVVTRVASGTVSVSAEVTR